jgi:glycerol-3-phosphate dehydrogenase
MARDLRALDGRHFDAVIVGGGINGAGVARDAALRGISVCLFEKGDYASGTSSKSTKIAHGGLRYLKHFEFGLVFESQQERHILRRLLPHLVWPQSFCYPVYDGDPDPLWLVRLGVGVYDLLATFRNVERHRHLSPSQALAANPGLKREGLQGAVRYWDDRMDDARICLENVLSAERSGAVCHNYVEVLEVRQEGHGYRTRYRDVVTGAEGAVSSRAVVNCGGPWGDEIARRAGVTDQRKLAPTKGVHIVVPRLPLDDALVLPVGPDGRIFFVIPWGPHSLIGTTDTPYDGPPEAVDVEVADVEYLLAAAARYLPGQPLSREAIAYAFAGLRPLIAPPKPGVAAGAISRRHRVFEDAPGFLALLGGKFTTYRRMAEQATDRLSRSLGFRHARSRTRNAAFFPESVPAALSPGQEALFARLKQRYGPRAGLVLDCVTSRPEYLRRVVDATESPLLGELAFALEHEHALTLADLLQRRTRLVWEPALTPSAAHAALDVLAPLFGDALAGARAEADALGEPPAWRSSPA